MIQEIEVSKLKIHPKNVRQEYRDIDELAESLKTKGVLQNLTVVKNPDEVGTYYVVIGNRRLTAARKAGLATLPCQISDMDEKEQVATMLLENMQRNDLTISEQAYGFQYMLDLGETENSISEKTGLSKPTVRHRLNIAKLDREVLRKKEESEGFQLTLGDLYELEKISDVKLRDKILLEAHDSRDLAWKARQAARSELIKENRKKIAGLFKTAGIKRAPKEVENERYSGKWEILKEWRLDREVPKSISPLTEKDAQWVIFYGETAAIIKRQANQKRKLSEWEIKERELSKRKKEIRQKCKVVYADIERFIRGILSGDIKALKEDTELYKALQTAVIDAGISFYSAERVYFFSGMILYELEQDDAKYKEFLEWDSNLSPLHKTLVHLNSIRTREPFTYNGDYSKESADQIKAVVNFLSLYGFSVSDEGKEILDGCHELFNDRKKASKREND